MVELGCALVGGAVRSRCGDAHRGDAAAAALAAVVADGAPVVAVGVRGIVLAGEAAAAVVGTFAAGGDGSGVLSSPVQRPVALVGR